MNMSTKLITKGGPTMEQASPNQPGNNQGFSLGGKSANELQSMGKAFFGRLTIAGKLLLVGGFLGVIACFLPFYTVSISGAGFNISSNNSGSSMAVNVWQGIIALLAFAGCAGLTYLMFGDKPHAKQRELIFGTLITAGLAAVMTLWLFFQGSGDTSSFNISAPSFNMRAGKSIGAYLMLACSGLVVAGAVLKAMEDKVFQPAP